MAPTFYFIIFSRFLGLDNWLFAKPENTNAKATTQMQKPQHNGSEQQRMLTMKRYEVNHKCSIFFVNKDLKNIPPVVLS